MLGNKETVKGDERHPEEFQAQKITYEKVKRNAQ
jgi:hypothetical protein